MRLPNGIVVLLLAVLFPRLGNAQPGQSGTPRPQVNAATATWQVNHEPIVVQGLVFYATRDVRMFDAQVMTQIAVFQSVPIYADVTLEPFSIVYVPIGPDRMRTYERLRAGDAAGTTGSRTPTYPVAPIAGVPVEERVMVGTSGASTAAPPATVGSGGTSVPSPDRRPAHTRVESIPRPSATNGIWLEYSGARWYSSGAAVPFTPERFTPVGAYRGFPVYRDKSGDTETIWVSVVQEGPVAPYRKR